MLKRKSYFFGMLMLIMLVGFSTSMTSCARKVGCAVEEQVGPKTNRDGTLSLKRGKTNLFSKKQRRKMRKTRG